jgi:hypothetical protein
VLREQLIGYPIGVQRLRDVAARLFRIWSV